MDGIAENIWPWAVDTFEATWTSRSIKSLSYTCIYGLISLHSSFYLLVQVLHNGSYRVTFEILGSFRKLGVPYLGVPIIRILLVRVLYLGPLFSETPIYIYVYVHGKEVYCQKRLFKESWRLVLIRRRHTVWDARTPLTMGGSLL